MVRRARSFADVFLQHFFWRDILVLLLNLILQVYSEFFVVIVIFSTADLLNIFQLGFLCLCENIYEKFVWEGFWWFESLRN